MSGARICTISSFGDQAIIIAIGRRFRRCKQSRTGGGKMTDKPDLLLLIAAPRCFCAGVDRAILIVERALERYGAPVYVRHEIVHNKYVVDELKAKGAIFVEELDEVPDGVPVIFSAHGVPKLVPARADERGLNWLDATCPLVSKVHRQAERLVKDGFHILFVGHRGHPEVIGTFGQVDDGCMTLVETLEDVASIAVPAGAKLSYLTQTTLSVDDTDEIISALKARFLAIQSPRAEDICYATSNRQDAVKALAERCEKLLVIGATNSSNSLRLAEVGERRGIPSRLIQRGSDIDFNWLGSPATLGLTAGASAPETLVREVIDKLNEKFAVREEEVKTNEEHMVFKLPRQLVS
jgi:4-hydroxy-3-methylbut-2-en-1-yl diphosphate reductase